MEIALSSSLGDFPLGGTKFCSVTCKEHEINTQQCKVQSLYQYSLSIIFMT